MRERSEVANKFIFLVFILSLFIVWFDEAPILAAIIHIGIIDDTGPFKLLLVIIIVNLFLLLKKKDYYILSKILNVCQTTLLIYLLIEYFFITAFMVFAMVMLTISLLEMINLFFKSPKAYKFGLTIIYCLSFLCLILFCYLNTTLSRFEYKLNSDGQSYSIVDYKSKIHTIRIPSTYKGLPVTCMVDKGLTYKGKIKKIIFEEDSHIEVIAYLSFSGLENIKLPRSLKRIGPDAFDTNSLEEIIIPIEVIYIDEFAFDYCKNTVIYCEAESRPETWDEHWCYEVKGIVWGYKG